VDDRAFGYFSESEITTYLNNAQREVQKLLIQAGEAWYMKCATTALITGTGCYKLPDEFLKIHKFELIISGQTPQNQSRQTLVHLTPNEIQRMNYGNAVPVGYYLKKDAMEIRPYPDFGYSVEMLYSYLVADMVLGTDQPDVPLQYHELLAIMASIDCFLRDQRDPSAFMAKKDGYIALMKQDSQQRLQDQPRSVTLVGLDDSWSAW
jgi:hypothetical protein